MQISTSRSRVVAVLGPTNTGKTHLAMERMMGHASGMIGFPLRLLARENYDRAVKVKGRDQVALITGEEKIVPSQARYFLCTVESMPLGRPVAFLGIDEIQLAADPDRGHVFTDRLLHARGEAETMFMGADTIRPLIRQLIPEAEIISRPRFSTITHTGPRKVTRLPARSAVVAFSAADVYALAELMRRQRGGAAVVLGALSPRTRNAQVGMFQAGEVDYLVATDAIGMGLNMDVDHVAFAATRKFDGRTPRDLTPAEMAQIAGRAGRHMNDGTFGTTAEARPLDPEMVESLEGHSFEPLRRLFWRNAALRYTSVPALVQSLGEAPRTPGLVRARQADDQMALETLARDPDIARTATTPDTVRLLWEVCRIPDFRKIMSDAHTGLLRRIFLSLTGVGDHGENGRLATDWVARQVARLDHTEGDIETLVARIAGIRTWTYVSHRGDWLADHRHWQERTRAVEDRLSDALHERLTQRFVDQRTAVLMRRLKDREQMTAAVGRHGEVTVEGHYVGSLEGFRFAPDEADGVHATKAVAGAALKALRGEIAGRVRDLEAAGDEAFSLTDDGTVLWQNAPVARLAAGAEPLTPQVEPLASDLLEPAARERLRQRLAAWLPGHLEKRLAALFKARTAAPAGAARGIVFQLGESLGSLPRRRAAREIAALSREDRRALRRLGVRLGRESIFMPALLRPDAAALCGILWSVHSGAVPLPATPPPGRVSLTADQAIPAAFYEAVGYRVMGSVAVRVDMLERLAGTVWELAAKGPFAAGPDLLSLAGCGRDDMAVILDALGYEPAPSGDGETLYRRRPRQRRKPAKGRVRAPAKNAARRRPAVEDDSPFAKLKDLVLSQ